MSPQEIISSLDSNLQAIGEDIVLRYVAGSGGSETALDVVCRARVTSLSNEEIAAGITQDQQNVIISPTQITAAGWPGTAPSNAPPFQPDQRIPRVNVDQAIVQGRLRTIMFVAPQFINGTLVRIDMRVSG